MQKNNSKRILIIRFSAFGDVAMTIPVICSLGKQYPQLDITVLSRDKWEPLFASLPGNIHFMGVDFIRCYKGFQGLNRLYCELKAMRFDYVADFHSVLRSRYLCFRYKMHLVPVAFIDKGRRGKRKLVRRRKKVLQAQKPSFNRYADVLKDLGFPIDIDFVSIYKTGKGDFSLIQSLIGEKIGKKWIGIAPFAKHKGKIYPLAKLERVIAYFAARPDVKVFLFGMGIHEHEVINDWVGKYPSLFSICDKMDLHAELVLMSYLDVMLSMDSANMHLASLVDTPVVSIWGSTHPFAGFMGWRQLPSNVIQRDLSCRPCSVYGQKTCWKGNYECLTLITPEEIIEKVNTLLL